MEFVALICALVLQKSALALQIAGPHTVVGKGMGECPEGMVTPFFPVTVHITRNRTNPAELFFTANFTTKDTFDDDKTVRLQIASWSSNGGWKENAYIMNIKKPCSSLKKLAPVSYHETVTHLYNSSNMLAGDCPWKPDHYLMANYSTNTFQSNVKSLYYGQWRIDFLFFKGDTAVACFRGFAEIVPKVASPKDKVQ